MAAVRKVFGQLPTSQKHLIAKRIGVDPRMLLPGTSLETAVELRCSANTSFHFIFKHIVYAELKQHIETVYSTDHDAEFNYSDAEADEVEKSVRKVYPRRASKKALDPSTSLIGSVSSSEKSCRVPNFFNTCVNEIEKRRKTDRDGDSRQVDSETKPQYKLSDGAAQSKIPETGEHRVSLPQRKPLYKRESGADLSGDEIGSIEGKPLRRGPYLYPPVMNRCSSDRDQAIAFFNAVRNVYMRISAKFRAFFWHTNYVRNCSELRKLSAALYNGLRGCVPASEIRRHVFALFPCYRGKKDSVDV